jgi:hypothetical protein
MCGAAGEKTMLTIRADEFITAFADNSPMAQWFLDTQTGEVFPIFFNLSQPAGTSTVRS